MSAPRPEPDLEHERRLYDRAWTLTRSRAEIRAELDELASAIRVAHLALERARDSGAWRLGHSLSRLRRAVTPGRGHHGSDALDSAMAKLAALEARRPPADAARSPR